MEGSRESEKGIPVNSEKEVHYCRIDFILIVLIMHFSNEEPCSDNQIFIGILIQNKTHFSTFNGLKEADCLEKTVEN